MVHFILELARSERVLEEELNQVRHRITSVRVEDEGETEPAGWRRGRRAGGASDGINKVKHLEVGGSVSECVLGFRSLFSPSSEVTEREMAHLRPMNIVPLRLGRVRVHGADERDEVVDSLVVDSASGCDWSSLEEVVALQVTAVVGAELRLVLLTGEEVAPDCGVCPMVSSAQIYRQN